MDDLDCHQGGFLLEAKKVCRGAMTVIEKVEAGKHSAPLGCAPVDADSVPSSAPSRSRWLTVAVLAVVAGFFVATLAARWNDVISLKWRLEPGLFAVATVLLALSYGLVACLWGPALVVALLSRLWMMLVELAGAAVAHWVARCKTWAGGGVGIGERYLGHT
ncbi:MAG TPA: hypothetical protein VJB61_18240 [Actinomycetota bacterium]